jgi:type IX secretion system PorP/SprF family membrane protein
MNIMKKHFLLISALLISVFSIAQQDPHFTHFMYNNIYVNPAYAGSRDLMTVGLIHRSQWIGLDGAPQTQNFYIHSPLKNKALNLGFSLVNDKIGPLHQTMFYGDFAYRFNITENTRLAFGLKAGLNLFQPKLNGLVTTDANDPNLTGQEVKSSINPNVGFGVYLNNDKWYLGMGIPKMIQNKLATVDGEDRDISEQRHYFFIGGLIMPITEGIKLKPTAQFKMTENAPSSLDIAAEMLFNDRFNVGVGHRLKDSFFMLAGINITDQMHAGLSWDFTTSKLNKVNDGTLEFLLMYDFMFKNDKLKSPRYF